MNAEIWKPIPGYESQYEASDAGQIRSLPRRGERTNRMYGGRVLRQHVNGRNGYAYVSLCKMGAPVIARRVHVLVLAAHVGPRGAGMQTRHLDGNKLHNALVNLAYGTATENAADRESHGHTKRGNSHSRSKVTDEQRAQIRASYPAKTQTALGKEYGITQTAVWSILNPR